MSKNPISEDMSLSFTKESIDKIIQVINELPYKYGNVLLGLLKQGLVKKGEPKEVEASDGENTDAPVDISN